MREGDVLELPSSGRPWRVGRLLGEGSQGRVHELECTQPPGGRLAVKWYPPHAATTLQRSTIRALVDRGSPGEMFLWPLDVVDLQAGSFAYTMPLVPDGFVGLGAVMRGRIDLSPSQAVRIAIGLAHGFLQLHSLGLCYRDISFGNVLVDAATGRVRICDNDNVGVDGAGRTAVLGTRRFMAPEIVCGDGRPGTLGDLHALAVLIFYVLMVHHPLLGRRELDLPPLDPSAERRLFGDEPLFIFAEDDDTNAPDPIEHAGVLANWAMHPPSLRALCAQAFGEGLSHPSRRVRESVWRTQLSRALDAIVTCPGCGRESFFGGAGTPCWSCARTLDEPPRLDFARHGRVLLGADTRITAHHLRHDYDVASAVAQVVRREETGQWGLRNVGDRPWVLTLADGQARPVPPGRAAALVPGSRVDFGEDTAVISG